MILNSLANSSSFEPYLKLPVFRRALDWLRSMPENQPLGIVELSGREMYVNVHGYDTLGREACRFESHRRYVDVQYCIRGGELIDYCPLGWLPGNDGYDAEKDFIFHQAPAQFSTLRMTPGDFAIFFPDDGHRPKVHDGIHSAVHKLVIKIDLNLIHPSS